MNKIAKNFSGLPTLAAALLSSCVSDPNYDLDQLNKIDTDMNIFGQGLELPIGQTEAITLENALKLAEDGSLDSLLKKDSKGNYSISASGDYNLDEVLSDLHLEKLRDINGASFSNDVEYKIGDFGPSQFKIEGKTFSYTSEPFSDFNLDDIPIPSITAPDQTISAELYKYLPSDMDLGKYIGTLEQSIKLLDISELQSKIPGGLPGDTELSVQDTLSSMGKDNLPVSYSQTVDKSIAMGENVSQIDDVDNFRLKSGSALKVELEMQNCPLTGGQLTPDLDLNISSMLALSDAVANKLDLSGLILNKSNSWKSGKSFSVSGLASDFPEYDKTGGKLNLKGLLDISGNIVIQNAVSTPNTIKGLSTKSMTLKARISLDGVVLDEMDITLNADGIKYSVPDVDVPLNIDYTLPDGVSSVSKVYLDTDKKLEVSISATNLKSLKSIDGTDHISAMPDVEITFPSGLEVAEAENGKVTIKGEDLYDGDILKKFTLVSFTPTCKDKKLTFNGNVTAKISAGVSGKFSSKHLPTSSANDVVVTAKIGCQPALKDYDVLLDEEHITQKVSETQEFSFEMAGMADFGTFRINLKNSPVITIDFSVPVTTEVDIIAKNLVLTIPQMMVVDGSGVSGFDAGKNTLTLNGKLPEKIELPIKYLVATPQTDPTGKTVVTGAFSVNGSLTSSDMHITRITFDEINRKTAGVTSVIPTMEAESIEMEGDFNKSLDYDAKDVVILDEEALSNIPSEVKSLDDITLDGVNAIIEIKIAGLPDMEGKFILKDTKIQLPSFLYGENDSHTLILDDEIDVTEGKAVVQMAQLTKLKDIQLSGKKEITGDIKFCSSLYSHKPSVDVSTLKSTIKVTVKVGVGNGTQADHPGKIAISKALVKVGYTMEEAQSISFGTISPELQDESVNLALNPELHLEFKTNFGAPVKGDLVMTPYIAGKALDAVTVKDIEMPCSDDWNKVKVNKYAIGAKAEAASDETLIATDLSPLLKRIPDSIRIEIKAGIDESGTCTIFPEAKYSCDMGYEFGVPMSFGNDFNLDLTAEVEVDTSINSYLKMADKIKLSGDYETTLPVAAKAAVTLLDPDRKVIELNEPVTLAIGKSDDGKKVNEDSFELLLSIKEPKNVNLKTIQFNIQMDTSPGVNLKNDQYIQIKNLKALLPGGINVTFSK